MWGCRVHLFQPFKILLLKYKETVSGACPGIRRGGHNLKPFVFRPKSSEEQKKVSTSARYQDKYPPDIYPPTNTHRTSKIPPGHMVFCKGGNCRTYTPRQIPTGQAKYPLDIWYFARGVIVRWVYVRWVFVRWVFVLESVRTCPIFRPKSSEE